MTPTFHTRFRPRLDAFEERTVPTAIPAGAVAIGADANSAPKVTVIDPGTGSTISTFTPFEQSFRGGVSVALGDVTGDDLADLVVAARSSGGPRVSIIDGGTGEELKSFFVYEPSFRGGVTVAVGDVNGDGVGDLIAGTGGGGGPRVVVVDVATEKTIRDFFAYEPGFRGGVNVASDDVNGDGFDDIAVGSGRGGAPRVVVFDGKTGAVIQDFFAFDSVFRDGVNVGLGDVDGDGDADVVAGAGDGGAPHVRITDARSGNDLGSFFAFASAGRGGVTVATADVDGDGDAEIITGNHGQVKKFLRTLDGYEGSDFAAGGSNVSGNKGRGHGKKAGFASEVSGAVQSVNEDLDLLTLRTSSGQVVNVRTDAGTTFERNGADALLADFAAGDFIEVKVGRDRVASSVEGTGGTTGATTDPAAGSTVKGAVAAVDESAGTVSVRGADGKLYLVTTDTDTKYERNGVDDVALSVFLVGDFAEVRIGSDGVADKVQAVGI